MSVSWLSLSQVQDMVTKSVDFGAMTEPEHWEYMIKSKASDTGTGNIVADFMRRGWLESNPLPIIDGYISEAHHRLVAALLLCLEPIPVVFNWEDFEDDESTGPGGHDHWSGGFPENPIYLW